LAAAAAAAKRSVRAVVGQALVGGAGTRRAPWRALTAASLLFACSYALGALHALPDGFREF
jgi:hypothetical protein